MYIQLLDPAIVYYMDISPNFPGNNFIIYSETFIHRPLVVYDLCLNINRNLIHIEWPLSVSTHFDC